MINWFFGGSASQQWAPLVRADRNDGLQKMRHTGVVDHTYDLAGMYLLPGGTGLEKINSKLREAASVKLEAREPEPEVELTFDQMQSALDAMNARAAQKLRWECPNLGCDVCFEKKNKYIRNTWPEDAFKSKSCKISIWKDHRLRCSKRNSQMDREKAEIKRRKLEAGGRAKIAKRARELYLCPFAPSEEEKCQKEFVCKFTNGCLKHFQKHPLDPHCIGEVKEKMLKYAKDNGLMKTLKKRDFVCSEIVAA